MSCYLESLPCLKFLYPLEEWEEKILNDTTPFPQNEQLDNTLREKAYRLASLQTTASRARQWLSVSMNPPSLSDRISNESRVVDAALVYTSSPSFEYKRSEASYIVSRVEGTDSNYRDLSTYIDPIDPFGNLSSVCVVWTLLLGDLSRNRGTVLSRCFFKSGLREAHLLPLISKYVSIGRSSRRAKEAVRGPQNTKYECKTRETVASLLDFSRLLFLSLSPLYELNIYVKENNHLMGLLPLLFSVPSYKASELKLYGHRALIPFPSIDLTCLQHGNHVLLCKLFVGRCTLRSLSSLSPTMLPSLHTLALGGFDSCVKGLRSLEGLTNYNTNSLLSLFIFSPDLVDISALSSCRLSSLHYLSLYSCESLRDLSPLCDSPLTSLSDLSLAGSKPDFSSLHGSPFPSLTSLRVNESNLSDLSLLSSLSFRKLKRLNVSNTPLFDLSPLRDWDRFAPERLDFSNCPIADISPLTHLNLFYLKEPIHLRRTKISDVSCLESVKFVGVKLDVRDTQVARERRDSKQSDTVGKVKLYW